MIAKDRSSSIGRRALVLFSWLLLEVGCSTPKAGSTVTKSEPLPTIDGRGSQVYVFSSFGYEKGMKFVYTRVRFGKHFDSSQEPFSVYPAEITVRGHVVDISDNQVAVDLAGQCGSQGGAFVGAVPLDRPFSARVSAGSGPPGYQLPAIWFGVSTNSNPEQLIDQVNAYWHSLSDGEPDPSPNDGQPAPSSKSKITVGPSVSRSFRSE